MREESWKAGEIHEMQQLQVKAKGQTWKKAVVCKSVKDHWSQNKFYIVKLFNMQNKQLFLSATEDDITDVVLDAKNFQLKQTIDGIVIAMIAE